MSEKNNSIGLNELVDYQKKTYSYFMDKVMRFLWKCGGADAQILQYAPYSDHIKNAGIGGVVLATSVMASLAMGFAMHTIFGDNDAQGHHGNWAITIPVAVIWGLIIFNLDRFIVSTVKGDGTEKITLGEWGAMLPRLVMAIIIGLTISAPLETHIFEKEIVREWSRVTTKMGQNEQNGVELKYQNLEETVNQKIKVATKDWSKADSLFILKDKEVESLEKGINGYLRCTEGANCRNGQHRETYKARELARSERDQFKSVVDNYIAERNQLQAKKNKEIEQKNEAMKSLPPGFLDQLMMLEKLSHEGETYTPVDPVTLKPKLDEKGNPVEEELYSAAFWPIWLVRLLFMIVEIAPVIFKFMIWKSSYDYMQDNVAQILEAKQGISLEHIVDEENKMHKVKENYNARRIVEVSKRQNELEKENAIHAITLYAEKEREEIEKSPEKFIQSTDPTAQENPDSKKVGGDDQQPKV
jgi:hypothetical protein